MLRVASSARIFVCVQFRVASASHTPARCYCCLGRYYIVLFLLCFVFVVFSFSSFDQENKASQELGVYKFCVACNTCIPSHSHLYSSIGWWSHLTLDSSISSADAPVCSAYSISLLLPHHTPRILASEISQHSRDFINTNFVIHFVMVHRLCLSQSATLYAPNKIDLCQIKSITAVSINERLCVVSVWCFISFHFTNTFKCEDRG